MPLMTTCPECQKRFEIPDDLADQPIQCHNCMHVFARGEAPRHTAGIQAGTATKAAPASVRPHEQEEDDLPLPSRRPSEPRARFPVSPLLIVALGILFFLLVASVGFNVWFISNPAHGFRRFDEVRRLEEQARANAMRAEAEAARALAMQQEAQRKEALLQRQVDELQRQLEAARQEILELKKRVEK